MQIVWGCGFSKENFIIPSAPVPVVNNDQSLSSTLGCLMKGINLLFLGLCPPPLHELTMTALSFSCRPKLASTTNTLYELTHRPFMYICFTLQTFLPQYYMNEPPRAIFVTVKETLLMVRRPPNQCAKKEGKWRVNVAKNSKVL